MAGLGPVWQDSPGQVNDLSARFRLDQRFVRQRPPGYGWLLWVSWPLAAPWAGKRGANWEPEWSVRLTAQLVAALTSNSPALAGTKPFGLAVAQLLGADTMTLLFYLAQPDGYRQRLLSALDQNGPVGLDYGISRDKDWLRFQQLLGDGTSK